jgi:hypothetical protein
MYLPSFILLLILATAAGGVGVSATLETGTWHCPKYIHYYSNTTTSSSSNQAPPCNDTSTSTSPITMNPKPKPARDYKPACCDAFSFPANSNGAFEGTGCESTSISIVVSFFFMFRDGCGCGANLSRFYSLASRRKEERTVYLFS